MLQILKSDCGEVKSGNLVICVLSPLICCVKIFFSGFKGECSVKVGTQGLFLEVCVL